MGVLGEMFPGRKVRSEAGEAGDGQGWRLGPIDLDSGVVEVHRAGPEGDPGPAEGPADEPDTPAPTVPRTG